MDYIQEVGFLPLLSNTVRGFSAEESVSAECRYHILDDGRWEWPLWKWKGAIITESNCMYGKFFDGKAGFISYEWWPDFCNWRRSLSPAPDVGSIDDSILEILRVNGSMITRDLRAACGFNGPKMRGRFDNHISHLQKYCRIVTEDFIYPHDRHNRPYGWGWALLTTPEKILHTHANNCKRTPQQSHDRMMLHLHKILPQESDDILNRIIG